MNFKDFLENEEYRGEHEAPDKTSGFPLHDLKSVYHDIYDSPVNLGAINFGHYGQGDPRDIEAVSVIKRFFNKPNWKVKIYRAVPNINADLEKRIKKLGKLWDYVQKFGFPPIKDEEARDIYRNLEYNKDKFITYLQDQIRSLDASKSPRLSIKPGDWVTTVRAYAVEHGQSLLQGKYKIVTATVPAKTLFTDANSILEFGYDPS
jgi:hypothetical protein